MSRRRPHPSASDDSLFGLILDHPDALVVVDREGVLVYMNPEAERLFGRDPGQLLGYPLGLPVTSEQGAQLNILTPEGEQRLADMRSRPTTWEGRPAHLASLRDVTSSALASKPA
ncbi:MAG TPA: PAS domain-containing protein [Solirubrobacteraceae bacterium]|jgi:PAS domain-containing protein|nr:PAS domain-containing protein [Solirubrobacteraceae bacterium]